MCEPLYNLKLCFIGSNITITTTFDSAKGVGPWYPLAGDEKIFDFLTSVNKHLAILFTDFTRGENTSHFILAGLVVFKLSVVILATFPNKRNPM
jgi:hypothetical protein